MTPKNWPTGRLRAEPSKSKRHRRPTIEALEGRVVLSWLGQVGGTGYDAPTTRPVMDAAGNVYVLGSFSQVADFDPGDAAAHLTSSGGEDAFVAKYTPYDVAGQPMPGGALRLLWARRFGGSGHDEAQGLAVDASGQTVSVTGVFEGTANFGSNVPALVSAGAHDAFVLKLDAATGTTTWAKRVGGSGDDWGNAVAVGADGVVYATGSFTNTVDFDPGPGTASLTATGKGNTRPADAFVLRLDANGNYLSAWQVGGSGRDSGESILVEGDTLYLQGSFSGTADFAPGSAVVNRTSAGGSDAFFARYTTSGSLTWVGTVGGVNSEDSWRMVSDGQHLYITGGLTGTADFDPGSGTLNLTSAGSSDAIVAKYSKSSGSLVWARRVGGTGSDDACTNAFVDPATGEVYVGGRFSGTVDFDPGAGSASLTSAGGWDPFVLKLDAAGNYLNAWRMGSASDGESAARPMGLWGGILYVAGRFLGTADFPSGGTLSSQGDADIFLMALDQSSGQSVQALSGSATGAFTPSQHAAVQLHDQALMGLAADLFRAPTKRARPRTLSRQN